MWWLTILQLAIAFIGAIAACRYYIHMLQLESYQLDGYMRWLKKDSSNMFGWTLRAGAGASVLFYVLPILVSMFMTGERRESMITANLITGALFIVYTAVMVVRDYKSRQKKPLVYTRRVIRLIISLVLVTSAILAVSVLIFKRNDTVNSGLMLTWLSPYALMIAAPFLPMLAAYVVQPVEEHINMGFFKAAQAKLDKRSDLIKIGITGSYGKTSTKYCLATILSVKYNVFYPKASINTPMGLSKVINNDLEEGHQVFIAEMGARHVGDIKELVDLVHPSYGLITSVGPQHLETFKTVETVANTKFELIEGLPKNGCAFFAADDGEVDKLYERAKGEKKRAGLGKGYLNMHAEDIEVGAFGSRFTLVTDTGENLRMETKLLGRHNISNIVLCCAVAREMGMTMEEISQGVKLIKPVKHRLQLISGHMNVIDDAFNSNPVGAKEALNVVGSFPGKHLIITPGFVELGEDEAKFNYRLGVQIAKVCDAAILVGPKHTTPIRQGLIQSGFSEDCIRVVNTLEEATALIPQFASAGDCVLFENDLPDNYTE
ncbi:MAG: UDP-N-acetylmuramoyl-tripeptide--D-alanyl-D-alanine ligase [Clostridia bacterium]|nr:UDP-N-acetylmuramoyl-tripeptide--D-alanyl-D-alanine ligase [Clostridia bacterium]